jgi:transcriptional regulator with XRE-family HTH domain
MATHQNIIGPRLQELRKARKLTQGMLAARCELLGWNASENTITKIETQIRCVTDKKLVTLCEALRIKMPDFFPKYRKLFS